MTRAELEHIRGLIASTVDGCACIDAKGLTQHHVALAALDAELARPEPREWRVSWFSWRGIERNKFESLEKAKDFAARKRSGCEIESRTPAGPWERAE